MQRLPIEGTNRLDGGPRSRGRGALKAVKRGLQGRSVASGFDGLHKRILAMRVFSERFRQLYNNCLKRGIFSPVWRRANLVLLQKESKEAGSPSAYKSICLLDKAGKLFERVIASRLVYHLFWVGPNINGAQYEFRKGLSTRCGQPRPGPFG